MMQMKKTCIKNSSLENEDEKNMYYENIALDDVDEKTCITKTLHLMIVDEKNMYYENIALDGVDKKTCIIKTLHLMMQMKNMYFKKHCT